MNMDHLSNQRVIIKYEMPMGEMVIDFYNKLKSVSKGYASFDYEVAGFRSSDVVLMEILLHGTPVDALSVVVHKDKAQTMGRALCAKLKELIGRPQITLTNIAPYIPQLQEVLDNATFLHDEVIEAAEILLKYEGYIGRERIIADKLKRLENIKIKGKFNYNELQSLSTEARQKLSKIDPETIAQASRIPGVSPSDINVLLVLCGR